MTNFDHHLIEIQGSSATRLETNSVEKSRVFPIVNSKSPNLPCRDEQRFQINLSRKSPTEGENIQVTTQNNNESRTQDIECSSDKLNQEKKSDIKTELQPSRIKSIVSKPNDCVSQGPNPCEQTNYFEVTSSGTIPKNDIEECADDQTNRIQNSETHDEIPDQKSNQTVKDEKQTKDRTNLRKGKWTVSLTS